MVENKESSSSRHQVWKAHSWSKAQSGKWRSLAPLPDAESIFHFHSWLGHYVFQYTLLWFPRLRIMTLRIMTICTVFMTQQNQEYRYVWTCQQYKRFEITKLRSFKAIYSMKQRKPLPFFQVAPCVWIKILYSRFQQQIFKFLSEKLLKFLLVRTWHLFFLLPANLSNAQKENSVQVVQSSLETLTRYLRKPNFHLI